MRRVIWFDEDERRKFQALIKSADIERQTCNTERLHELDRAINFVNIIVKEGINI